MEITEGQPKVAAVLRQVAKDLKTIASDEIELGQHALADHLGRVIKTAAVALLGAFVALIGLAMLCSAGVAALAPVIPQLWLRLILMAIAYLAIGGGLAMYFSRQIAKQAEPDLSRPAAEIGDTVDAIEKGLSH